MRLISLLNLFSERTPDRLNLCVELDDEFGKMAMGKFDCTVATTCSNCPLLTNHYLEELTGEDDPCT